jgi:hypothetical protein
MSTHSITVDIDGDNSKLKQAIAEAKTAVKGLEEIDYTSKGTMRDVKGRTGRAYNQWTEYQPTVPAGGGGVGGGPGGGGRNGGAGGGVMGDLGGALERKIGLGDVARGFFTAVGFSGERIAEAMAEGIVGGSQAGFKKAIELAEQTEALIQSRRLDMLGEKSSSAKMEALQRDFDKASAEQRKIAEERRVTRKAMDELLGTGSIANFIKGSGYAGILEGAMGQDEGLLSAQHEQAGKIMAERQAAIEKMKKDTESASEKAKRAEDTLAREGESRREKINFLRKEEAEIVAKMLKMDVTSVQYAEQREKLAVKQTELKRETTALSVSEEKHQRDIARIAEDATNAQLEGQAKLNAMKKEQARLEAEINGLPGNVNEDKRQELEKALANKKAEIVRFGGEETRGTRDLAKTLKDSRKGAELNTFDSDKRSDLEIKRLNEIGRSYLDENKPLRERRDLVAEIVELERSLESRAMGDKRTKGELIKMTERKAQLDEFKRVGDISFDGTDELEKLNREIAAAKRSPAIMKLLESRRKEPAKAFDGPSYGQVNGRFEDYRATDVTRAAQPIDSARIAEPPQNQNAKIESIAAATASSSDRTANAVESLNRRIENMSSAAP